MALGLTDSKGWNLPKIEGMSLRPSNFLKKPEKKAGNHLFKGEEIRAWVLTGVLALGGIGYGAYKVDQHIENERARYTENVDGIIKGRNISHKQIGFLTKSQIEEHIQKFEKKYPGLDPIIGLSDERISSLQKNNSSGK